MARWIAGFFVTATIVAALVFYNLEGGFSQKGQTPVGVCRKQCKEARNRNPGKENRSAGFRTERPGWDTDSLEGPARPGRLSQFLGYLVPAVHRGNAGDGETSSGATKGRVGDPRGQFSGGPGPGGRVSCETQPHILRRSSIVTGKSPSSIRPGLFR